MSGKSWPHWIPGWLAGRRGMKPRRSIRPSLERLEERLTPTGPITQTFNPVDTAGLISALQAAANAPSDTTIINLKTGATYTLTQVNNYWYGPDGLPPIESNVFIHGNGAVIQRDTSPGTPNFRLFYVSGGMELPAGNLSMDNVTVEGGVAKGGDSEFGGGGMGAGGAIFNQGVLNLIDVTLTLNEAVGGSSGVASTNSFAGGGIGSNAFNGSSGGFGGSLGALTYGGLGGAGGNFQYSVGGGGGGLVTGANGASGPDGGAGGGNGGIGVFGTGGHDGGSGGGGGVGTFTTSGDGGSFGYGGSAGDGGGGGGVGGGGGGPGSNFSDDEVGAGGGFGGGGAAGFLGGGYGGFGGGGGGVGYKGGVGGAIFNMGADSTHHGSGEAHTTLINCTLAGNSAFGGGSTIQAPFAAGTPGSGFGGAIFNLDGQVELDSATVVGNHPIGGTGANGNIGGDGGDAVYNLALGNDIDSGGPVTATLVLNNSIVASTSHGTLASYAISGSKNLDTAAVTGSHNLVTSHEGVGGAYAPGVITQTADPNLGPLQNNGGLTPTMLPGVSSPVLGAGDPSQAPAFDQRGIPRPPNGPTDIGAVQVSVAPSPPPAPSPSPSGPPTLQVPPLLAFFDSILGGIDTVNGNGTETVTDSIFGIPLVVSTFNSAGSLVSVTLFGINITFLFG